MPNAIANQLVNQPAAVTECHRASILGTQVAATDYPGSVHSILRWAARRSSRYVCAACVHSVMEAYDSPEFRRVINEADLVTPDGMPLVWGLRALGVARATRVYGPDLTLHTLEAAESEGVPVGFYGAGKETLTRLLEVLRRRYPRLLIACACSPPFRPLSAQEDSSVTREINESGARILFVGLGAPKQEYWMARHKGRVRAVMLGVGAAFDFLAGTKPQAPRWMMSAGIEWLFRLVTEPRRLGRRYLWHNSRFVVLFLLQLTHLKKFPA